MKPLFWSNRNGATAVEFALIAPVLMALVGAVLGLGLAFWTKSALQQAATETARCIAIGSPRCSTITTACDSASPGICYMENTASERGISGVVANQIVIDRLASFGGASFTTVTVDYPFTLFGYEFVLEAQGHFPNPDPG